MTDIKEEIGQGVRYDHPTHMRAHTHARTRTWGRRVALSNTLAGNANESAMVQKSIEHPRDTLGPFQATHRPPQGEMMVEVISVEGRPVRLVQDPDNNMVRVEFITTKGMDMTFRVPGEHLAEVIEGLAEGYASHRREVSVH